MSNNIKRTQKETLLKVWNYIKRYRFLVCCSFLSAGVVVALTLYLPILVGEAIDYIVEPGKIDFTTIRSILMNTVIIAVITAVLQWIMNMLNNTITYNVIFFSRKINL